MEWSGAATRAWVHHANTNNMWVGETHVPRLASEADAKLYTFFRKVLARKGLVLK